MAQFDVHQLGEGLVIDCQSDLLRQLHSRLVVPLVRRSDSPDVARRLNPIFQIGGQEYVMLTQAAAAVRLKDVGTIVTSLKDRSLEITDAFDVLLSGV